MKYIFLLLILLAALAMTGCTINFKAEKLELETDVKTPEVGFSNQIYKIENICM